MAKIANSTMTYTQALEERVDTLGWVDDAVTDTRSVNPEETIPGGLFALASTSPSGNERFYHSKIQQMLSRYTIGAGITGLAATDPIAGDIASQLAACKVPNPEMATPTQIRRYGGANGTITVTRAAATNSGLTLLPANWTEYFNNRWTTFSSIAANTGRFPGVRQGQGVLVEPAATNLCLRNGGDTTTSWTGTNATLAVVTTGLPAPPYGSSSVRATANGVGAPSAIQTAIATADGTAYVCSLYVYVPTPAAAFAGTIRLEARQTSGAVIGNTTITERDQWVRKTVTVTPSAGQSPIQLGIASTGTEASGVIIGYVQLGQVEATAVATTPIVTGASSSLRAVDQVSATISAADMTTAAGTLLAWCPETPDLGAAQTLCQLTGASASTLLQWSSADALVGDFNGTAHSIAAMNHTLVHCVALTWTGTSGVLYRNGASAVTQTIAAPASLGTTLTLGGGAAGANPLGAPIIVWAWPYALSAQEIAQHFLETDRGGTA